VEIYRRDGQTTDDSIIRRMLIACCILKATSTHSEYVIYCFSTATMVTKTLLTVTSYVHCLYCYSSLGIVIIKEPRRKAVSREC
jgi:hypothetical protein